MAANTDCDVPRYSAFISYTRSDAPFVRKLHRQLEAYRLPRRLVGSSAIWDLRTRRLKPVFRDLDELTAAPDLSAALQEALTSAAWLIVVCSPQSAASKWVGREVDGFRARHGDSAILAALIDGSAADAIHPALRRADGDGRALQPIAADFRPQGDGRRLALLKLVAVMAGVGLGELVQRDAQRRLRQMGAWAAGAIAVLLVVLGLTIATMNARVAAERERARGGNLSGYLLNDLRTRLKSVDRLDLSDAVNKGVVDYYAGQDLSALSGDELQQRARLLQGMGEDAEKRGDLAMARKHIEEARRSTAALLKAAPSDPKRIFAHAQSEFYAGMINWRGGNSTGARAGFEAYRELAQRLLTIDPHNADWLMEAGWSEDNLGMFALRTAVDTRAAEGHFRAALAAFDAAAKRRPGDRSVMSAIADAHAWMGDTRRLQGDFDGAAASRMIQRRMLEGLLASDPRDKIVEVDLVSNQLALARIAAAKGEPAQALAMLEKGRAAALALARDDPENMRRAAQVRIFDLFRLRTWLAMPASARPSAAVMAAANGDCMADRTARKNAELATFCDLLAARRSDRPTGGLVPAEVSGNRLTEIWGLDLRKEAAGNQA